MFDTGVQRRSAGCCFCSETQHCARNGRRARIEGSQGADQAASVDEHMTGGEPGRRHDEYALIPRRDDCAERYRRLQIDWRRSGTDRKCNTKPRPCAHYLEFGVTPDGARREVVGIGGHSDFAASRYS